MFCPDCGAELETRNKNLKFYCNCGFNICNRHILINQCNKIQTYYGIFDFFKDLKKEISIIEGKTVNFRYLSINYLEKISKWYINDRILRAKGNPNWKLKFRMLNDFENSLTKKLGKIFEMRVRKYFNKYISFNLQEKIGRHYSKFTISFFKQIDTKQKMYWYLWLLAEGNFTRKGLKIEINPKDGILLKRFIEDLEIDPNWIYFSRRLNSKTGKYYKSFVLELHNIKLLKNIINGASKLYPDHIVIDDILFGKKSHRIRFPRFASKDVLMAGVLGFFDGDGSHAGDTARIGNIMSKTFLEDIVEVFDLLHTETKEHWENGKIRGYYLSLGAEFFNELILNFERSLPRKRRYYKRIVHKFPLTQKELQKLVSNNFGSSGSKLALIIFEQTGIRVGRRTVLQKLLDWNIERSSKEEWKKQTIITLRRLGWDLRRIWTDKEEGLGFSPSGWCNNRWRFFNRIFREDPFIQKETGTITERIEKVYFQE